MNSKLTPKQRTFCEEYLVDLNATQAAIRAGYSKKTAKETGCENLSKPNIQDAIRTAMDERSLRTRITVDRVLAEIAKIGFSDIREIFTADDKLRSIADLPDDIAAAVQSIEVAVRPTGLADDDGFKDGELVYKIKLSDKLKGLELLGKHLGMFNSKVGPRRAVTLYLNYGSDKTAKLIEQSI
ncbi:MAG: terminase small subunit [Xanthomonadales bacterium]|nr:terminase small subunit [Xanthomonadales bacterium]